MPRSPYKGLVSTVNLVSQTSQHIVVFRTSAHFHTWSTPRTLALYADCVLISGNILGALFYFVAPILEVITFLYFHGSPRVDIAEIRES